MNPRQERDEWLMAQAALGKREHLEVLIRRYATPLLSFIQRMVGDRHHSEELFQEVFLTVWTKRKQYQFPRSFKPWLYAIAANRCRAVFRMRAAPLVALLDDDSPAAPAAQGESPSETAIATETAALVQAALARLPPQQRLAVVLHTWDGLSYAEIAQIAGRSEATVRSNMHHGLTTLRRFLEPRLR